MADIEDLPRSGIGAPATTSEIEDIRRDQRIGQIPGLELSQPDVSQSRLKPSSDVMRQFRSISNTSTAPENEDFKRLAGRIATETGGAFTGSVIGQRIGSTIGMRAGEAVGAGLGSLVSETFDPTERPFANAFAAGAATLSTGMLSTASTIGLRKALGKPHAAGQALIDELALQGRVPPAGAVLDGPFAADAQSFGGGAFFVGRRIAQSLDEAEGVVSENFRHYISTFQRYHDGAKVAFAAADKLLDQAGIRGARGVVVQRDAIDALRPAIDIWKREGLVDKFPADLQWLLNVPANTSAVKLNINEAATLQSLLYNRAREIEATPREISTAGDATKLSAAMREVAGGVQTSIDKAIDEAIRNKQLPAMYRQELVAGKALWKQWIEGTMVEDIYVASTKDLTSMDARSQGGRLLRQLDMLAKREHKIGHELITPKVKENIRRYAVALQTAEASASEGAFKLAVRQGQLVGYSQGLGNLAAIGVGAGAGAAIGGQPGAATGAGFIALAPPALAFLFTNDKANALMIRGLRAKPGSAATARIARELTTMMAVNGWVPPLPREANNGDPFNFIPTPTPAPEVSGSADPFASGAPAPR